MFLFGLEGSGFIIAVALTLLVSGAIMFYCLKRFSVVETAITEQGKILQSFIQNSQMNSMTGGLASSIAIDSARQQTELSPINEDSENNVKSLNLTDSLLHEEKIEVSDDDNSEDDSNDDSEDDDSEEECNLENLNMDDKEKEINIETNGLLEAMSVQDIIISKISNEADVKLVDAQVLHINGLTSIDFKNEELNKSTDLLNDSNLNDIEEITDVTDEVKLDKLKVGDLRNLVVQKNLLEDSSKAAKMKKEELLKLLN